MKAYIFIGLAVNAFPAISATCCPGVLTGAFGPYPGFPECDDKTMGTPCCATGGCNIFCCNCDGHCRRANNRSLASADERDPDVKAFALADTAGNGNLTLDQYLEYMEAKEDSQIWIDWFQKHDRNGDGVITEDEVESV